MCRISVRSFGTVHRWLVTGMVALALASFAVSPIRGEQARGIQRWAILSAHTEKGAGLADLLTAELSRRKFELVERAELAKVTSELKLANLVGTRAAGQRLQLGKLLKADALLLVDIQRNEVQTVICECRFGARLSVAKWPAGQVKVEKLVTNIADQAVASRRRYGGGIRQIFAVTPFVSKNLLRTHDSMQAGYAHLLQSVLQEAPGAACLEVEEARAIARELQVDGSQLEKRNVPVFVEGQFEVARNDAGQERINLLVRTHGRRSEQAVYKQTDRTLSEATDWLTGTVANEILTAARLKPNKRLTQDEQKQLLQKKADEFVRYRAWPHVAGLREAALLLDPDDPKLEMAVVTAYRDVLVNWISRQTTDDRTEPRLLKQIEPMFFHIEQMIARGNLGAQQATQLISMGEESVWVHLRNRPRLEKVEQRLTAFLRTSISQIPQLSAKNDADPTVQREHWVRHFMNLFVERARTAGKRDRKAWRQELDHIHWLLADVVPREAPPVHSIYNHVAPNSQYSGGLMQMLSAEGVQDVKALFRRLSQTDSQACKLYSRSGLLALHIYYEKDQKGYSAESEERVKQLMAYLKQQGQSEVSGRQSGLMHAMTRMLGTVRMIRRRITRIKEKGEWKAGQRPTARHRFPVSPALNIHPVALAPRVRFEEIKGVRVDWFALEKVDDTTDVMWTLDTVRVSRKKGVAEQIFDLAKYSRDPADFVRYVKWDGEGFWIITNKSGVYAVSGQGVLTGRAPPGRGLPPYSADARRPRKSTQLRPASPLLLEPIAPGKCVAVGKASQGSWIASLQTSEKASADPLLKVSVLHKAVADVDAKVAATTIQGRFGVGYITRHEMSDGKGYLLVGPRNPPLRISLPDLTITPYQGSYFPGIDAFNGLQHVVSLGDRRLLRGGYITVRLHTLTDETQNRWSTKDVVAADHFGHRPYALVPWKGQIYCYGSDWCRIDPKTAKAEPLCDARLPRLFQFDYVVESAHYGLIAWFDRDGLNSPDVRIDRRKVFRVLFAPDEPAGQHWLYWYIPREHRARHARAIEAIWKSGGRVGDWSNGRRVYTHAILDKNWKGGDEGLAYLRDVYGLEWLHVSKAAVTDKGMRHVGALQRVTSLVLDETQVTNVGLQHLGGMPNLNRLVLKGPFQGKNFGDAGLAHLANVPLTGLRLDGWNFTDAGLESLRKHKSLQSLSLAGTAITKQAIEQSQRQQPRLRIKVLKPEF